VLTRDGTDVLIIALATSFTVIGLDNFLYTAPVQFQAGPGSEILRWACDSLIVTPVFALAIWAAQWIAGRRGIGIAAARDVAARALLITVCLAIVMIPVWFGHNWLNNLTQSEPLVPVHVHGKTIGANIHWVSDPVVLALIMIPLLALAGWGAYLIAVRVRVPGPKSAAVAAKAALIAVTLAAAPALAWVTQKAADKSNSAQVYATSALLHVHVHSHVLFQNGRLVPLPKGPPVTPAPYEFIYQVAHAFQDGLAGMAIGLPVAIASLAWIARRLHARGNSTVHRHATPTTPLMEVTEQ
jgi:hypothetical protein